MFNIINEECLSCINLKECGDQFCGTGQCNRYMPKPTKQRIKYLGYMLAKKKIKLKTLCKNNHLQLNLMKSMIQHKTEFTYKYYKILESEADDYWTDSKLRKYESRFQEYVD